MDSGATTTLLLLHGFTNTGASWDGVVAALGPGYRPLAPDIRGHGTAARRRPVTLEAVLGDLDALDSGTLELAGYSMGGRIALHAAIAGPLAPRVRRLTLIGASPGIDDPAQRAARRAADERLASLAERLDVHDFARVWARTPVLAGQPPEVAEAAHADRLRNPCTEGLAEALRGLGTGALPSVWERLGDLRIPVSLVVGERDAKFRALAQRMAARLPRASVTVVPRAGHAVHLEAPAAVAAAIRAGDPR
ncbi:MAG TPA: alpha/beta fold hydrolase [Solirubrobacteraceae bacterium]|nr:alpha/beta fold hydrolase [Solirubrobacteraceae bacterium]